MRNSLIIALAFGALTASPVLKANITYDVSLTVGVGSMTGSITTDGTIGTLGTGEIVAWNLTLNDGTNIIDLTTSNSVTNVIGSDLTGTLSAIMFNFSADDYGQFVFYNQSSEPNYGTVCIEAGNNCGGDDSSIVLYDLNQDGGDVATNLSGNQVIASNPEPGTAGFWTMGIGLMIVMRRLIRVIQHDLPPDRRSPEH